MDAFSNSWPSSCKLDPRLQVPDCQIGKVSETWVTGSLPYLFPSIRTREGERLREEQREKYRHQFRKRQFLSPKPASFQSSSPRRRLRASRPANRRSLYLLMNKKAHSSKIHHPKMFKSSLQIWQRDFGAELSNWAATGSAVAYGIWKLVSAQVVRAITKLVWQLGRYEPSPPSTTELHGLVLSKGVLGLFN